MTDPTDALVSLHSAVTRANAMSAAKLAAYRFAIRETLALVQDITKTLPPEVRNQMVAVERILERLSIDGGT